ncbi:hypothetical protein CFE70_006818 [Pyrenophora teres f. teres 0-1]|nr:hypothetical protein PTNB85_07622 [Pyrenophora teres f. teres]KAE8856965.1 hypothetical protein PTNB29_08032 [Pyrenophora teres f. teres]
MMRGGAGGHPGMMGNGMMGNGMMPPPGMQHPLSGMPPAYTTHPSMPHLPIGGMNMNPYLPGYPGPSHGPGPGPAPSSTSSSSTAPPAQPPRRGSGRRYEHVPTGAYASTEKPRRQRPHVEQQTSARLNKGQSSDKKVGPSGREWIDGDPFLDACICTTGCDCRKNQRVLYRARHDRPRRGRGSDDDSEDDGDEYGSGEIRYILRDDLGRNCGDHSGCKKDKSKKSETSESGSEDSKKKERKKKRQEKRKEEKKEEKKRKESFQGLKDDLLEALDSRFYDMNKASRQQQPTSTIPPQPPQPFGGRGMGPSPFMMGGPHHMDPRIAQQMGAMGGDGYRMGLDMPGRMPPGMSDPTSKRGMQYQSMGMGMDMGGGGGMVNFEDDISEIGPLSMGMPSPYAIPAGMQNHKAGIRRNFMSQGGARAGGAQGQFGGSLDMDPMAAVHAAQAMAQGRGRGRRGIMRGHMGGGGQPYSEPDDFDFGAPDPSIRPSGIQRHRTAAYDRPGGPRDRRRNSNDSCSVPRWHKFGVSPQRRATSSQDRSRQPRVDTDDDEAY